MKMEGYYPLKMKRKDLEQVYDEFSDFSLSAPARKIRRLDAELPPILEEVEDDRDVPVAFEPSPSGQSFGGGHGRRGVVIEELPDNKETAIVLFKPMDTPFVLSPQNFSVKVDPQFISGLKKNQVPWRSESNQLGQAEDGTKEMGNSCGARKECLAVVPWVPSQFPTHQTEIMMDAEEMEVEDNGIAAAAEEEEEEEDDERRSMDVSGNEEGLQQWQQQHCMLPQPPHNVSTPITWYR